MPGFSRIQLTLNDSKFDNLIASQGINLEQLDNPEWLALALADLFIMQCHGKIKKSDILRSWGLGILANKYKAAEARAEDKKIEAEYYMLLARKKLQEEESKAKKDAEIKELRAKYL